MKETIENSPKLLPGERVEWCVSPDWSRASKPQRRWLILLWTIVLAIIASMIAVAVIHFSGHAQPNTFGRAASSVGILIVASLTIYLWIKVVGCVFAFFQQPDQRPHETYTLTDRRLIVTSGSPATTQSVTSANYLLEATLRPNGRVHDLMLWFGPRGCDEYYDYGEPLVLHAIENGELAKSQILERFGPSRWQSRKPR